MAAETAARRRRPQHVRAGLLTGVEVPSSEIDLEEIDIAPRTVLLLGRTPFGLDDVRTALHPSLDIDLLTGTSVEDVSAAFADHQIDTVIMGAGIALETRLEIARTVFEASETTTVHMKDRASGRSGMMAFVNTVLRGLSAHPD